MSSTSFFWDLLSRALGVEGGDPRPETRDKPEEESDRFVHEMLSDPPQPPPTEDTTEDV
jgi:hypothetical protein